MKRGGEKIVGSGAEKSSKKVLVNSTGTNGKKNVPGDDPNHNRFISKESSGKTSKRPFGSQSSTSSTILNSRSLQSNSIYEEPDDVDTLKDDDDFQDENVVKRKRYNQMKAKIKKEKKEETSIQEASSETNVKDSDKQTINQAAVQVPSEARIENEKDTEMSQKETEISNLKGQLAKNKIQIQKLQLDLNKEHKLSTGLKKETKKLQVDLEAEKQSNSTLRNDVDEMKSIIASMVTTLQEFGRTLVLILSEKKGISHPSIATGQKDFGGLTTETVSSGQNSSTDKLLHENSIHAPPFQQQEEARNKYQQNQKSDETSIVVHDISDNEEKIHEVSNELTSTNTRTATEEIVEDSREIPLTLDTPITRAYRKLEQCNRLITSNLSHHVGSKNYTLAHRCKSDPEGNHFRCTNCNISLTSLQKAISHEALVCRIYHSSDVLRQIGVRIVSCDECGKEVASTAKLIIHKQTHSLTSRNFACPVNCGSYFRTQIHANQHYKSGRCKLKRIQQKSVCEICRRTFTNLNIFRYHIALGHIPTSVQVYAWVNGTVIRRDQVENDQLGSKKEGIWVLYGMPIYHAKFGYLLCIGRSSYWDIAITAFRNVKKCVRALKKLKNSLLSCTGCGLRKLLNEGWVALPDLAFRIGGIFVVGSILGSKIKWYEREKNGDAYVLAPPDLNQFIEDAIGTLLEAEVDKVRHLFEPSADVRATTRQVGKDYVFKGVSHILKRKVIDGPFQGPSDKKYLDYLEDQNKQLI